MKKLLLVLFAINCFAQSPTIEWRKTIGGSLNDLGASIHQTNDGGYIAVGGTLSNNIMPISNHHGSYDIYLVKMNSVGVIEWEKTIGGSGYDVGIKVFQTMDNNYVLSGYTSSNDGDILFNHGDFDFVVIKLDTLGNILWQKTYGGTQYDQSFNMIQTNDGGYIISGNSNSSDGVFLQNYGLLDCWIIKIDPLGNIEWKQNYGGSSDDFVHEIISVANDGYIFVGHTGSNDIDVTQNQGYYDAWIVKINNLGVIEWQKSFGGSESDFLYRIKKTIDGGYITCGQSDSINGDLLNNNGLFDSWILKLDSLGNIEWNKTFGGSSDEGFESIVQLTNGDYIFAGSSLSNDFDVLSNYENSDSWILKLSNSGSQIWQKNIGGSGIDNFSSIITTSDNGFAAIGTSTSNDFDLNINYGEYDILIVKLSPEQLSNSTFQQLEINVSPNPASHQINLHLSNNDSIDKINVTDLSGKLIVSEIKNTNQIDISNLSKGLYFIEVFSKNNKYQSKFIKQ